jgi:glutamyl-Q tRNA(Asp) synthetase
MNDVNKNVLGKHYRGRFAPSPSGPLHFGSLITALASFIHAKQHQGTWLVRIEDIDPPREQKGASALILSTLEAYGLHWDENVLFQSQQTDYYQSILDKLANNQLTYYCHCTRAKIKEHGGIYQGHCRERQHQANNSTVRLINQWAIHNFTDVIQGQVTCDLALAKEDFTLRRKDGLFAYQLAVVLDDIEQNISHVIRGCDLLEPTARQLTLFKTLGHQAPQYGHIPLAMTQQGYKLSKQNKAPALNLEHPQKTLINALTFLGQKTPEGLQHESIENIIKWAISKTDFTNIPKQQKIMFDPIKNVKPVNNLSR